MVYTSLAIVALSASAALPNFLHLNNSMRAAAPDQRITINLVNHDSTFREVEVAGRLYSINGNDGIRVVAPAGTLICAGGNIPLRHRGDVLLAVSPQLNHRTIPIR